ncbi:hypothetical protein CFC21_026191 [Triticum aestivum]|uniref:DUF4220 domain-containing protein n=2 Tax=Triticum aestivum TaxID=4565 RepID=A0A3B6CHV5_WHEAT|nr:uncharacterized protein LOC123047240 [Triticum aestivum]KAF7011945.1 hypothetical protein CFC21_026191 [Triticum aestivum]
MSNHKVNDYCKLFKTENHLGNATVTSLLHYARYLSKSSRGTVTRIEVFVLLTAALFLFLATFGAYRRQHKNLFILKVVFGMCTLSSSLITYIFGSMQSSAVKSSMYSIWAISLFLLYGSTDAMAASSLDDTRQSILIYTYHTSLWYVYVVLLLLSVTSSDGAFHVSMSIDDSHLKGLLTCPVIFLHFIAVLKSLQRVAVCVMASNSWKLNKMVADYMYDEHTRGEFVPATMEGCHYLVDWPLSKSKLGTSSFATVLTAEDDEVIDIEKIWQCNDSSIGLELKYACLSFSLFHLLRRRYFGLACCESKERAHDFVFKGLLSENATDCNRIFRVIEIELAFMYDCFFTKYAVIYYASTAATFWSLASVICISLTAYTVATRLLIIRCDQDEPLLVNTKTEVVITLSLLACAALLELLQLLHYWTAIWARVSYVCQFIRQQSVLDRRGCHCLMRLKELLTKIGVYCASDKHYWQHKLGQYSLLESVSCNSNPSKKEHRVINKFGEFIYSAVRWFTLFDRAHMHRTSYDASVICMKPGKPIELPTEVKEAIVHSLEHTDGKLTNGNSSLVSNGAEHLLWACGQDIYPNISRFLGKENQTHLIMTWHIATCYCEMTTMKNLRSDDEEKLRPHLDVATKLSKYCAYLVVSARKLLPGHRYDTLSVLDAVAVEATKFLKNSRDRYEVMRNLAESEETIFEGGTKLGKQLEEIEDVTHRWKVLADFWAEMLLYLAPSDNVKEHIEELGNGGEFITHLWALLTHAGILERQEDHQVGSV